MAKATPASDATVSTGAVVSAEAIEALNVAMSGSIATDEATLRWCGRRIRSRFRPRCGGLPSTV